MTPRFHLYPLLLASVLPAQSTIISPTISAMTPGGGNSIPWQQTNYHYMQVHSDIGGSFKLINKVAFRQSASTTSYTGTRAIDLEMFIGDTVPYDQIRQAFAANYLTASTKCIARKIVNFGPQGQGASPSPFVGMDLVLDTPFPYVGIASLGWEVVVYTNTLTGTWNSTDADQSTNSGSTTGTVTGAGCGASHTVSVADNGGTLSAAFAVTAAPASQPAVLAVGGVNPNLSVPGLCSSLQTDMALQFALGATSAAGAIALAGPGAFHLPNTVPGVTLYSQIHVIDPASTNPIPVHNSNGRQFTVPVSNTTKVIKATRLYASGTASVYSSFATVGVVGYALVTQFTY
jgi:hypothetical protein